MENKLQNILYLGCYCLDEIISGPEKVAKRIFNNINNNHHKYFIEYFFVK